MATANFDTAAGISQQAANSLLADFYTYFSKNPNAPNNPFVGQEQQNVPDVGNVTLNWNFQQAPTVIFGAPSQANWAAARNSTGKTNQDSNTSEPDTVMIQLIAKSFNASYTLDGAGPPSGTADIQIYGTVDCKLTDSSSQITATMLAVLIDESQFTAWDQAIFNDALLPMIFKDAAAILQPVQFPGLVWQGIKMNPATAFALTNNAGDPQFVAVGMLEDNQNPLTIDGAQWPTDTTFALASIPLINAVGLQVAQLINGVNFGDSDQKYNQDATWSFSAQVTDADIECQSISPLLMNGSCQLQMSASANVDAIGLAAAFKGCTVLTFFNIGHGDDGSGEDSVDCNYDVTYTPNPVSITVQILNSDKAVWFTVVDTDFKSFSFVPDPGESMESDVLALWFTPIADYLADKYKGALKDNLLLVKPVTIMAINDLQLANNFALKATGIRLGDAKMPFGDMLKISATVSLVTPS